VNDHILARICDAGLYAAHPNDSPVDERTTTVSPGAGSPVTEATAPLNTQG
jgi:hypothetical protein